MLGLPKQMAFDSDLPTSSLISGMGFSFDELNMNAQPNYKQLQRSSTNINQFQIKKSVDGVEHRVVR
jgi:hypothetical protein